MSFYSMIPFKIVDFQFVDLLSLRKRFFSTGIFSLLQSHATSITSMEFFSDVEIFTAPMSCHPQTKCEASTCFSCQQPLFLDTSTHSVFLALLGYFSAVCHHLRRRIRLMLFDFLSPKETGKKCSMFQFWVCFQMLAFSRAIFKLGSDSNMYSTNLRKA